MKALVLDHGIFPELALMLARDLGGKVGYFSPWASPFPDIKATLVGTGLEDEDVERVDFPWALLDSDDEPDIWVFPDLYFSDWQSALRKMGKAVWGAGAGELLELDRFKLLRTLNAASLPVAKTRAIDGIEGLGNLLKAGQSELFIKLAQYYRGASETYLHKGWPESRTWFEDLAHRLGPAGDKMRFMLQDPIEGDAVEPGLDMLIVNGVLLRPLLMGYEDKDSGLISRAIEDVPPLMADAIAAVTDALSTDDPYTGFFSGEMRITEDGECYFIDATARLPRPGDAIHQNLCTNLAEIIRQGAHGVVEKPDFGATFGCQLNINSVWAKDHPLHIKFSDELRDNIKLYRFYRDDEGEYWSLPNDQENFAAVVTTGDDLEKVKRACLDIAKEIQADGVEFERDVFEKIEEQIEKGEGCGVEWA